MKSNYRGPKGFTIPELLAVLVILSVLVVISGLSYSTISKKVRENTLNEKMKYLQEKAYEYASDYSISNDIVTVNTLMELGYVSADHPENSLYQRIDNPVTGGYLDCVNFTIKQDLADYNITYDLEGSCDLALKEEHQRSIKIDKYIKQDNTFKAITEDTWVNTPIYAFVNLQNAKFTLDDNKITYRLGSITEERTDTIPNSNSKRVVCSSMDVANPEVNCLNVIELSSALLINNTLTASMNINYLNDTTYETVKGLVEAKTKIKFDQEKPTLTYSAYNAYTKNSVPVKLNGSDGEGSGIAGYYFSKDDITSDNEFQALEEFSAPSNGTYYAYTIDKAGNRSDRMVININNIDNKVPNALISYEKRTNWTTNDFNITFGCQSDRQTGCQDEVTYSIYDTSRGKRVALKENETVGARQTTYTVSVADEAYIKTIDLVFTIKDNLGNATQKEVKGINVLIDKVHPRAEINIQASEDRGLIRLKGYNFKATVYASNTLPSGVNEARYGFSTSKTNPNELKNMSANESDKYFWNAKTYSYYLKKKESRTFAVRVVSNSGMVGYNAADTNGKGCTSYLGHILVGGLIGGFIGGVIGWAICAHK